MTTSIERHLAKLDADIAKYSTWLEDHPDAPADHREITRQVLLKATSLRRRWVDLHAEQQLMAKILARAGGNKQARIIDIATPEECAQICEFNP